jgi:hypothetical protein
VEWPAIIVYVRATKPWVGNGVAIPAGYIALSTPDKIFDGWELIREMTAEEHKAVVETPYDPHHHQPFCFF